MISAKSLAIFGMITGIIGLVLSVVVLFSGCAAPKQTIQPVSVLNPVINQDLCEKAEACTERMVKNFNLTDLKDHESIKEADCKILAFACTGKDTLVMLRIHLVGTLQGQCINTSITVEGV